jgi:molybdopterin molybdotransferase
VHISSSLGRVLSQDIYANINVPPFDRSPFDGYALRAADNFGADKEHPAVFTITEEIPAGKEPEFEVKSGQAAKILTGAPIPKGADTTIKYEETDFTETRVIINKPLTPNENIVFAGEDIPSGTLLAARGSVISAGLMGVFAGQGYAEIEVYKRPVIAILNTGSELTEVGKPLAAAKIYNSNVYTLSAYLIEQGALPITEVPWRTNPMLLPCV